MIYHKQGSTSLMLERIILIMMMIRMMMRRIKRNAFHLMYISFKKSPHLFYKLHVLSDVNELSEIRFPVVSSQV